MTDNLLEIPKKQVLDRAYYLYLNGLCTCDMDRYYTAENIERKLILTNSYENYNSSTPICRFCCCRQGTIYCPFLPDNVGICWHCFTSKTKERLIAEYTECSQPSPVNI